MSETTYMVVFRGQLVEGADRRQVMVSLQQLCKLTHEKVEQLFTLPAVVLKKNLSHERANNFSRQLKQIGVITEVKAMDAARVVPVSESTLAAAAPTSGDETVAAIRATRRGERVAGDKLQVAFHGKGGEYFKIWIVNILLTILTLGIYSAWAKVRNHRYFYSNTQIGSGTFEYTAAPLAILKGRIVAVLFLLAFSMSGQFMPILGIVLQLLFIILLPWLINRSMAFRNRNTVYRNVRLGFDGDYWGAMKAFILWPLAGVFSVGILMPYALFRQKHYMVENSRYGTSNFVPGFTWREIYGVAIRAFLLMLLALGLILVPIIGVFLALPLYLLAFAYFSANMGNLVYNGSQLLNHGFESTLRTRPLAMIYLTNWLLLLLTLGLALPWAKVRLARYRAEHLVVLVDGSLDTFVAAEERQVSALGEEIGEAFDFDIGL
ncbi:MAG: YjgN family protein [Gammaproteobacteria bacterium]|nr:YjgN family protein [Gammaproteobacteria bacterium]